MARVKRETVLHRTNSIVHTLVVLALSTDRIFSNDIRKFTLGNAGKVGFQVSNRPKNTCVLGLCVTFARKTLSLAANLKIITGDIRERDLSSAMYAETNLDIKVGSFSWKLGIIFILNF